MNKLWALGVVGIIVTSYSCWWHITQSTLWQQVLVMFVALTMILLAWLVVWGIGTVIRSCYLKWRRDHD